jgi:hypothetical protein
MDSQNDETSMKRWKYSAISLGALEMATPFIRDGAAAFLMMWVLSYFALSLIIARWLSPKHRRRRCLNAKDEH